ncbi:MAG: hypothetical protein HY288_18575, partial [Planctomycetia bacterium]|nr:hypothetical protein [Planctomycetia bacterium]
MVFRPLRDLFGSPKPAKKKKLSRRHQQFGHFSGLLEPLEERRLLSVNVAYFDDQWAFVGDADNSQSLSLNDQLNNGNDPGAGAGTVQSTYGNDAFGIITTQPAGLVFTATGSLPGASRVNDAIANTSSGGTVDILHASPLSEGINVNSAVLLSGTFSTTGALALSAPGARISTGSAPGIIWAGSLTLSTNSVLDIKLNGTGFDQIDLLGNAGPTTPSVILSGAVLNVTVESGFTPAVRTSFTIIHDQGLSPVSGTFVGLNEGGVLAVGSQLFQISYKGGTGGDVVLTKVQAPSTTYVDTNWTLAKDFDSGG